jgi:predicted NBD/HSP70 family sugar kinase
MARSAAIPPLLKDLNERTVLDAIRSGAPISRAEISRRAGISKPTVSLALQSLLEAGLVRETQPDPGRPTYGATFFEVVPEAGLVLGLDLGARFLRGAICDLRGEIRARQDVELDGADAEGAIDAIAGLRLSLAEASGLPTDRIDGAVFGVPGVVDADTGRLRLATNVPGLEGRDWGEDLRTRLELPVTVENDINLAAVGERWRGMARGVEDFVFLSVGTGLGAGLVLRGELHRGRNGAAGEVDLVAAGRDDEIDPCASAVSALAERLVSENGAGTTLRPPYDARSIFAAARAGDEIARKVVEEEARRIALHIAPVSAVTDIALVVLGGGIGVNADLLLDPIRDRLTGWLPYPPRVEVSSLGDAAVLTGALAVGLRSAVDNVFANRLRVTR